MEIKNPYLELFNKYEMSNSIWQNNNFKDRPERFAIIRKFSFAVPTNECAEAIKEYTTEIVEIGCGSGYWAWFLAQHDITVHAYDKYDIEKNSYNFSKEHFPFKIGNKNSIKKHPEAALFLCWPDYDESVAVNILKKYKGKYFFYVGETQYGCCADDEFFEYLNENFEEKKIVRIPQHWGIHDAFYVYKKRK